MDEKKQNCWEYKKCGRETGGNKAEELGICPASEDASFNGINRGENAGRICWAVAGTFCGDKVQGTFADKRQSCMKCDFFRRVREDEGAANLETKFLKYLFREDGSPLIENMTYQYIKAGERFVTQGKIEDTAFIIQKGSCLAIVELDGELHPVYHYGEGDIVGGTSLLTGAPRKAHVDAETDMKVWVLNKYQFAEISKKDPDLLEFLTELVANRFDSRRPTAYREIGKYISTDIIGSGGYSIVYKGVHSVLNMPVAIKMLRHNMAMDKVFLEGFHNEAKTIAGLKHENIVRVYDIEELYKTVFIIMELVEGNSLRTVLDNLKKLPPYLAIKYIMQICAGLDYAHKRNIIHRDVNPSNIIVQNDDSLKILDFGLACLTGTEDFGSTGTVFYVAPEQVSGDAVGRHTDIYSLGIMAHEMLTGKRPFPEDDLWELRKMHEEQDIPDPATILPDIPRELRYFIMKAGNCDPGQRYQTISEVMEDLRPIAEAYGLDQNNNAPYKKHKMTNLMLIYNEDHQLALSRLMAEFRDRADEMGVVMKVADFQDV